MKRLALRVLTTAALALCAIGAQALTFAINEGVTYRVPNEQVAAKYAALAADLSRLLHQPVTVEPVGDYKTLRTGLATRSYDLALVHPAHVSIAAIKNDGYTLLAVTKGYEQYRASILVKSDSPLKTLADLKGQRLGAPDEDSITTWMVRASLRDAKVDPKQVSFTHTRYQDAVPFFVDNNLTQAGATASTAVVKAWEAKGGRLLFQSPPVPIKHVIAGPSLSAEQQKDVRDYLLALDTSDDGRRKLEPTKYAGFAPYDERKLLEIGRWLGL